MSTTPTKTTLRQVRAWREALNASDKLTSSMLEEMALLSMVDVARLRVPGKNREHITGATIAAAWVILTLVCNAFFSRNTADAITLGFIASILGYWSITWTNQVLSNKGEAERLAQKLLHPAQTDREMCQLATAALEKREVCRHWRDQVLVHRDLLVLDLKVICWLSEREARREREQEAVEQAQKSLQGLLQAGVNPASA